MSDEELQTIWWQSIDHYGKQMQSIVCMEECAELIQAISKKLREPTSPNDHLAKELANHRAIAITVNDTVIDGRLIYHDQQAPSVGRIETLTFDVIRPVIVNINETGNILVRDIFKAINILKETK